MTDNNRQRRRGLHTGSQAWARIRSRVLLRDSYICRACGKFGNHVDHINNDSHDNSPSNLQTLCVSCHSAKTAREQAGADTGCGLDGNPISGWRA